MFAENLIGLGFLKSVSYRIKPIPTHGKMFAVGKSDPNATFNLFFLGLGWAWVGGFVGFMIIFSCFPTQQDLEGLRLWCGTGVSLVYASSLRGFCGEDGGLESWRCD